MNNFPALTENRPLRFLTISILYFTQGIQTGLFLTAMPAYLANQGVEAAAIAGFIGVIMLTVLGMSFLTEGLGLSNTLGPFLAGMFLCLTCALLSIKRCFVVVSHRRDLWSQLDKQKYCFL